MNMKSKEQLAEKYCGKLRIDLEPGSSEWSDYYSFKDGYEAAESALTEENTRLRKALEEITNGYECGDIGDARAIAKEALK